jgi:hypothetical protein
MNELPRGIEILLKKAAVDAGFRERLLAERAGAADLIGLSLTPAEAAALNAIPDRQLAAVIARTEVPLEARAAFLGYAAAAMLAALGALAGCKTTADYGAVKTTGINPDLPPTAATSAATAATAASAGTAVTADEIQPSRGVRPDEPAVTKGIRPDIP